MTDLTTKTGTVSSVYADWIAEKMVKAQVNMNRLQKYL